MSALYFPDEKKTGISAGIGQRSPTNHYFGAEFIYYQDKETFSGSVSGSATVKLFASGVTYKYFAHLSEQKKAHLYFGGGAGLTVTSVSATARGFGQTVTLSDNSDNDFSYQVLAGIQFSLAQNAELKLGWRYLNVLGVKFKTIGVPSKNLDTNAFELGMHFRF